MNREIPYKILCIFVIFLLIPGFIYNYSFIPLGCLHFTRQCLEAFEVLIELVISYHSNVASV